MRIFGCCFFRHAQARLIFSYFQDLEDRSPGQRRMDRLRRSLRASLRKRKHSSGSNQGASRPSGSTGTSSSSSSDRPHQWQADEVSVRSGTCSFHVKVGGKRCLTGWLKIGVGLKSVESKLLLSTSRLENGDRARLSILRVSDVVLLLPVLGLRGGVRVPGDVCVRGGRQSAQGDDSDKPESC